MPLRSPLRTILLGGLIVGALDGLDAIIFFGLRGVSTIRIFQAIAAGLLGREAFQGGLPTAALGVVLHYAIATTIVAVAYLMARRFPALAMRPILVGACYGVGVWLAMNFVVVPLSAANGAARTAPVLINGLLIHMLGVGIPAWLVVRKANRTSQRMAL